MKPKLFFLPLLALCSGCHTMWRYEGTGSLQTSGSEAVLLAHHSPAFAHCPSDREASPPVESFSVFSLGEECTLEGTDNHESLKPDPGSVCTVPFAEGPRTLLVTEVVTRWDRPYAQGTRSFSIRIGGDDAESGQHLLYSFFGQLLDSAPAGDLCDRERPRHVRALAMR
jgi:hypothetical protein